MRTFVIAAAVFVAGIAHAAVFTVGDTQTDACDFATIQEAIDAAASNGPALDQIRVTNSASYAMQALQIGDQSLVIEGGFGSCANPVAAAAADIAGNGIDPVLRIAPANAGAQYVTLHGLRLHGGGSFESAGGGIYVTNNTVLTIVATTIDENAATSGGGIFIGGSAGAPVVELDAGTQIRNNHAQYYGGGVYLEGGSLQIEADQVHVDQNAADDAGGGIASINGAIVVGAFGIAAARTDATGASVSGNSAGAIGGGLFVNGPAASLVANELIVDGNVAAVAGGGIAAAAQASIAMMRDYAGGLVLQCAYALQCSRLSNNRLSAQYGTVGGALALYSGAFANIAQTVVRDNVAPDASVAHVDSATLFFEGVLATANQSFDSPTRTGVALRTRFVDPASKAHVRIAYSTFAGNLEQSGQSAVPAIDLIAQQDTPLSIYSTVFADSVYPVVTYGAYTDDCVINGPGGTDAYGSHSRFLAPASPLFNNAAAGDYRLRNESLPNDYCDASVFIASYRDLALTPRCHDDPRKGNVYGACDAGAYESDHVFGSGLE